jgi:hypothetical protein
MDLQHRREQRPVRQREGGFCSMASQSALTTERLILRPLTLEDAPVVQHLAGRREIAVEATLSALGRRSIFSITGNAVLFDTIGL